MRKWLLDARKKQGKNQSEISAVAGITQSSYSKIENGKVLPTVPVAKKIATALGFEWTQFYDNDDPAQDSAKPSGRRRT